MASDRATTTRRESAGTELLAEGLDTRSSREVAGETLLLASTAVLAFGLAVLPKLSSSAGPEDLRTWIVQGGRVLFDQLGWAVPMYVTVLLAFYAVVIGGQILEDGAAARRRRRWLGFVAELMGAATILLLGCIVLYCWQRPANWAIMLVLIPSVGIIFFLAIQLGGFLIPDRDVRLADALRTRNAVRANIAKVHHGSRKPIVVVWGVNMVVITAMATFITVAPIMRDLWFVDAVLSMPWLLGMYGTLVVALLAWCVYFQNYFVQRQTLFTRISLSVMYAVVLVFLGALILRPWELSSVGFAFAFIAVASILTSTWPLRYSSRWFVDWTMHGATTRMTARILAKRYAKATREYVELRPKLQSVLEPAPARASERTGPPPVGVSLRARLRGMRRLRTD